METIIEGVTYILVDQTEHEMYDGACGGCIGRNNKPLCSKLPYCYGENVNKKFIIKQENEQSKNYTNKPNSTTCRS